MLDAVFLKTRKVSVWGPMAAQRPLDGRLRISLSIRVRRLLSGPVSLPLLGTQPGSISQPPCRKVGLGTGSWSHPLAGRS